ncbi:MAG TPA: DNA-processing protein DprA [Sphingobacteriaceae bacterium]|nr:DNA-processing protein DprA [Sphingobacteriaceae bacterium]
MPAAEVSLMAGDDHRVFLALLRQLPGLGPRRVARLVEQFGSAHEAWRRFGPPWLAVPGIGPQDLALWRPLREKQDPDQFRRALGRLGLMLLVPGDEGYPQELSVMPSPPPVLFAAGALGYLARPMVTIVGTRRSTPYGRQVASRMALDLSRAGVTVVSGLAVGIDGAAHRGALSGDGGTVAVLPCGLDVPYPASHISLARRIRQRGALLSEYGPGVAVDVGRLRARNRLMAALGQVVVVVEAGLKSGTMITVRYALAYGRTVAAVPGPAGVSSSQGCNNLIREGAHLVEDAGDVLTLLGMAKPHAPQPEVSLTPEERLLYALLDAGPADYEQLSARSGLPAGRIGAALMRLELRGLAHCVGNGLFVRAAPQEEPRLHKE